MDSTGWTKAVHKELIEARTRFGKKLPEVNKENSTLKRDLPRFFEHSTHKAGLIQIYRSKERFRHLPLSCRTTSYAERSQREAVLYMIV